MKGILALFPAFFNSVEPLLPTLLRWWFQGDRFEDPIDGRSYRKFLPYGYRQLRPNALCPGTLSLERHRLLWLYLDRQTDFLTKKLCVLHVARASLFSTVQDLFAVDYTTTDLHSPLADVKPISPISPLQTKLVDLMQPRSGAHPRGCQSPGRTLSYPTKAAPSCRYP